MTDAEFDEDRALCPDGNCLGVLADGRCNVCGRRGDGSHGAATDSPVDRQASAQEDESFDEGRQLCADGACTGLIGSDGKCRECGRSAAS